jgi:proteasome-associated ATPase
MSDTQEIIEELKSGLAQARDTIAEYEGFVEQLKLGALKRATFLRTADVAGSGKRVIACTSEGVIAAPLLPGKAWGKQKVEPGATVWISTEGTAVVALTDPEPEVEARVVNIEGDLLYVSSAGESPKLVLYSQALLKTLGVGDSVLMDTHSSVVLAKIQRKQPFTAATESVQWSDIGGLEDAKKDMIEAIELPLTHKEIFERYNKKPIKGVLLYGPPGCGKTMLGKAASTAVSKIFGNTKVPGFFYIKGPEVLSKWVGETESTIRAVFDKAREFKANTGSPAVIFIDEAEALLHTRHANSGGSGMSMTVVPTFLAEMDGLDDSGAMVLLSTNRPDSLDPAIVRDGRIDRKVHVPRPSKEDTSDIFKKYLQKVPTVGDLSTPLAEEVFNDKFAFYDIALKSGDVRKFGLRHVVSGAMVSGIVENAISFAMHREIEKKGNKGVSKEDLFSAVAKSFHQNKDMSHDHDMKTFVEAFKSDVVNIQKCAN